MRQPGRNQCFLRGTHMGSSGSRSHLRDKMGYTDVQLQFSPLCPYNECTVRCPQLWHGFCRPVLIVAYAFNDLQHREHRQRVLLRWRIYPSIALYRGEKILPLRRTRERDHL